MLQDDGQLRDNEAYCIPMRGRDKSLLSVSRLVDQGYECTPGKLGGVLRDVDTGDLIRMHRRDTLYVMRAWVKQDDSGFSRPE